MCVCGDTGGPRACQSLSAPLYGGDDGISQRRREDAVRAPCLARGGPSANVSLRGGGLGAVECPASDRLLLDSKGTAASGAPGGAPRGGRAKRETLGKSAPRRSRSRAGSGGARLHQQPGPQVRVPEAPRNPAGSRLPGLESECKAGVRPQGRGQAGSCCRRARAVQTGQWGDL